MRSSGAKVALPEGDVNECALALAPAREGQQVEACGRVEAANRFVDREVAHAFSVDTLQRRLYLEDRLASILNKTPCLPERRSGGGEDTVPGTAIADAIGKTVPPVAINWLLTRPTVSSVIIRARNEQQLRDKLGALGWKLNPERLELLDCASPSEKPYPHVPYFGQAGFALRNPPSV